MAADMEQGRTLELCGLNVPCDCCEVTCVSIDIDCYCVCEANGGSSDPLWVHFMDCDGNVLGSAEIAGPFCDPCYSCGSLTGQLDKPVNPMDIARVRIEKPGDDDLYISWMRLSVGRWNNCCSGKWYKLWKDCLYADLNGDYDAIELY
ncbi:MAG: hypothetical protein R3F46_07775 [bacterium]